MGNCASSDAVNGEKKPEELSNIGIDEKQTFVPNVGFVAKTKKPPGFAINKVFVNIFHHPSVGFVLCNDGQVGADKTGAPCVIYNTVINSALFNKLSLMTVDDNEASKIVVAKQIIGFINEKFSESLDVGTCVIPKMKRGYVGEEISPFITDTTPTNLKIHLERTPDASSQPVPPSAASEIAIAATAAAAAYVPVLTPSPTLVSTVASASVPAPAPAPVSVPAPVSTPSPVPVHTMSAVPMSIPLPEVGNSPPSMKGYLWRLHLNGDGIAPRWSRKYCMLLEGKINEDSDQTSLEDQKAYSFKLTSRVERGPDAVPDDSFDSRLSSMLLKALLMEYVAKARHAARGTSSPGHGQVELGVAAGNVKVDELLPQSTDNTISSCSTLIVLSSGARLVSSSGGSEQLVCYLCEGDKDAFRWTNAINAHLRHYFPSLTGPAGPRDEDDDEIGLPSDMAPPPIIQGNGKKQGRHLIKTWKQRYFVAENGVLSYYESAVDIYPYGVDKRGDIVLTTFTISKSHAVRKNVGHLSDTAFADPDKTTAIRFESTTLKENFVISLDNIPDETGVASPNTWFDGLQAHIAYAKAQNIS